MRQLLVAPAILVMFSLAFASSSLAGNITYLVNPVMFSDDISLQGGFITTNGTLGPLAPSDILDYEFVVSAPGYPYTFRLDNPGADIGITGTVLATAGQVLLPIDTDPSPSTANEFSIIAADNSLSECGDCIQGVHYSAGLTGPPSSPQNGSLVDYEYFDASDEIPGVYRVLAYEPQQVLVIAEVPEAPALVLALIGVCTVGLRGRSRAEGKCV